MNAPLLDPLILSKEDYSFFRDKIFELSGISLNSGKLELLQSRLRSRVVQLGMKSFTAYKNYLIESGPDHEEWEHFINQVTTNKTDWFREEEHFTFLVREFLPAWKKLGKKHLSLWCAASSTGEEPYTLSMVLHKALAGTGITYKILATDIDTRVLAFASNGVYPRAGLALVPDEYHTRAFSMGTKEISEWMKVKKEIRENVEFKQVNLTRPDLNQGNFDIVFCRNVLIYFNADTIEKVIHNLFSLSSKDGMLVISHSESLQNIKSKWKYVRPTIYQRSNFFDELIPN